MVFLKDFFEKVLYFEKISRRQISLNVKLPSMQVFKQKKKKSVIKVHVINFVSSRKRALKMKRVEEIREQNKKKQQEQQQELEKRLAEKRHLTNKIKEDRLKEEKAKHKIR